MQCNFFLLRRSFLNLNLFSVYIFGELPWPQVIKYFPRFKYTAITSATGEQCIVARVIFSLYLIAYKLIASYESSERT